MNVDRFFDALLRADDLRQRGLAVADLEREIRQTGTGCGDCLLWMTRACPREHNVNGTNRGPSASATVCVLYQEEPRVAEHRDRLRVALATARADLVVMLDTHP